MKQPLLTRVVVSSLLALNLNFVGINQAQAAACSAYDIKLKKAIGNALYEDIDLVNPQATYPGNMLKAIKVASQKSKSKKLRAAWKKHLIIMMNAVASEEDYFSPESDAQQSLSSINDMFFEKLC
jgi:hypothetical protein